MILCSTTSFSIIRLLHLILPSSWTQAAKINRLSFALTALPSILVEYIEDRFDPEEWMKAVNEEDEQVKNQKMKEMREQQSNNYNANDAMGDIVKDLVD
jgi:hypothetical protein